MSLHDSILSAVGESSSEAVEVPEWGCTVYVKSFSVGEWLDITSGDDEDKAWQILSAALTDDSGVSILTADEITAMPSSQSPVLMRLVRDVQRVNGGNDAGEA